MKRTGIKDRTFATRSRSCPHCGYDGPGWPDSGECPECGETS